MQRVYLSNELVASWKTKVSKRTQNNHMCRKENQSSMAINQSMKEKHHWFWAPTKARFIFAWINFINSITLELQNLIHMQNLIHTYFKTFEKTNKMWNMLAKEKMIVNFITKWDFWDLKIRCHFLFGKHFEKLWSWDFSKNQDLENYLKNGSVGNYFLKSKRKKWKNVTWPKCCMPKVHHAVFALEVGHWLQLSS